MNMNQPKPAKRDILTDASFSFRHHCRDGKKIGYRVFHDGKPIGLVRYYWVSHGFARYYAIGPSDYLFPTRYAAAVYLLSVNQCRELPYASGVLP